MAASNDATFVRDISGTNAPERQKSTLSVNGEEKTVGQWINQIGLGAYQLQVFLLCAGTLMCESAQLSAVSGIQSRAFAEYGITTTSGRYFIMGVLYIGFTFGTIASGTIGDSRGRRLPMFLAFIGMTMTQVLLYLCQGRSLLILYALLTILGFFAGIGIPAAVTFLSEVMPDKYRGLFGAALGFGLCMGELWTAIGLEIFMPDLVSGCWHCVLLWAAVPPVCLLISSYFCKVFRYDTAHFLAVRHQDKNLHLVLNLMADMNGHPELELSVKNGEDKNEEVDVPAMSFSEVIRTMTAGRMGIWTSVMAFLFFTFNLGYYGTVEFWPIGWNELELQGLTTAEEMMITASIGFVSVPIAMLSMANCPRRPTICLIAVLCAAGALCLRGLILDLHIMGWIGVGLFKLFWFTFQMATMSLPSEIYPTRIGVWGWSIVCFFGRIGCCLAPLALELSAVGYLCVLAVLLGCSSLLVWALPETSNITHEDLDHNMLDGAGVLDQAVSTKSYGSIKEP
jgi:MFS family permease